MWSHYSLGTNKKWSYLISRVAKEKSKQQKLKKEQQEEIHNRNIESVYRLPLNSVLPLFMTQKFYNELIVSAVRNLDETNTEVENEDA